MRFKKSIFASFLGHMFLFSVFSFSFGPKIPSASDYARINFFSGILNSRDMLPRSVYKSASPRIPGYDTHIIPLSKGYSGDGYVSRSLCLKPHQKLFFQEAKGLALDYKAGEVPLAKKNRPVVLLYPRLPYQFNLYFKDRQVAHVELMYNIVKQNNRNSITIIRKISSGNLDADLICLRYINNYLSAQQEKMCVKEGWKTVKIELSAKND